MKCSLSSIHNKHKKRDFFEREGLFFLFNRIPGRYNGYLGNEYWYSLISAGYRPTIDGKTYSIEAHLIDFSGDLYEKKGTLSFLSYIRNEIKFSGLDPLIKQMKLDKHNAKIFFGIND
ncbi:riboflavin kinase [Peribacillus cavernae]|nr:riboflavin kinase [Peribacillus cavernae]